MHSQQRDSVLECGLADRFVGLDQLIPAFGFSENQATYPPATKRCATAHSRTWRKQIGLLLFIALTAGNTSFAHTGHEHETKPTLDQKFIEQKAAAIRALNTSPIIRFAAAAPAASLAPRTSSHAPFIKLLQRSFGAFSTKVKTRSDARFFYVESDSIPDHQMMVGITAWQQQVPIPQPYAGDNAWQIPLHPVKADKHMSAKEHFFRGAIALAANGVPIFNPIKNDGRTDTVVAGELDKWGGHCGRADDYHYHIAPTHLQSIVGAGNPIAFALDGYPIFGLTEADGSPTRKLDWMNGHKDENGGYHYHATKTYPYLVGGFYGEVVERGGQVDPQPRGRGVRPYTRPLRGAKITGFTGDLKSGYSLKYSQNGRDGFVNYKVEDKGKVTFKFIDTSGVTKSETFEPRQRGAGGGGGGDLILRALDANNDGELSQDELKNAATALRKLDKNGDGQLSREETRGPGGGRGQDRGQGGGNRGDQRENSNNAQASNRPQSDGRPASRGGPPPEGERKPWIAAHLSELDTDKDGNVSRAEMLAEAAKTFSGYDQNGDGQLTAYEYQGRSSARSAMGGFVREHYAEFDRDQNKIISKEEVDAYALRMFTKADRDQNNIVTSEEANTRGGGGNRGKQRNERNR